MTKNQLSEALKLAQSNESLAGEDAFQFNFFAMKDFKPVTVTIRQLAKLIRMQCCEFAGKIDSDALNEIAIHGKKKFIVV